MPKLPPGLESILFCALYALALMGLSFAPLLSDLDYEFAQVAGIWTVWSFTVWSVLQFKKQVRLRIVLLSAMAILGVVTGMLITRFAFCGCSLTRTLQWFWLLPAPMALVGISLGYFLSRRRRSILTGVEIFLLSLMAVLLGVLWGRPIYVYSWLWGYIHGPIYDEWVEIPSSLVVHQLGSLAFAWWMVEIATVSRERLLRVSVASGLLICFVATGGWWGYRTSDHEVTGVLTRSIETGDIRIQHESVLDSASRHYLSYTQFCYERISEELQLTAPIELRVLVFADERTKKRLLGAGPTNFAKVWQNEIWVNASDFESVLKHEAVHVLADEFALPFISSSKPALVEGLAVAVDWNEPYFTPHEWSAALGKMDRLPPIRQFFTGLGFFGQGSRMSYIVAGSFTRFLVDTYGMAQFRKAYATGKFDEVYPVPLDSLESEWRTMLGRQVVGERDIEVAKILLTPSLFDRRCSHAVADMEADAAEAYTARDLPRADSLLDEAVHLDTTRTDLMFERVRLAIEMQDWSRAETLLDRIGKRDLAPLRRAEATILRGDILLIQNNVDAASLHYESCARDFSFIPSVFVACHTRLSCLGGIPQIRDVQKILATRDPEIRSGILRDLVARNPDNKVGRFWYGLTRYQAGHWQETIAILDDSSLVFSNPTFEWQRAWMLIQSTLRAGRPERTLEIAESARSLPLRSADRHRLEERILYARWLLQQGANA